MFKKYYFIHLKERNVVRGASSFTEWFGVIQDYNPLKAVERAREKAEPLSEGYYVKDIKEI